MPLAREDFDEIGAYIRENILTWLTDMSLGQPPKVYEIELRERIIRVEEGIKNQMELMQQGFARMDKRFEASELQMNKRFEQVDKRFEASELQMNKRFEQVDKRLEASERQMDKRFEQVEKRFEQVDKRFEQVDKRFESLELRMDKFMRWSFGVTLTVGGLVVAAIKYLP